eukprot:403345715
MKLWVKNLNKYVIRHCWQSEFELVKKIGKGANAQVYHVKSQQKIKDSTSSKSELKIQDYTLKIIKKSDLGEQNDKIQIIKNEIQTLRLLSNCKQIVQLYKVYESEKSIYLLLEYVNGGDLQNFIDKQLDEIIPENQLRPIMVELLRGLGQLHEKNIIHRDIKPQNILIQYSSNGDVEVKIADFGLAQKIQEQQLLIKQCGTPGFIAPEILKGGLGYDTKADLFSMGSLLFQLSTGKQLFPGNFIFEVQDHNMACSIGHTIPYLQKYTSASLQDLILKLLQINPVVRYDCKQALKHSWFSQKRASSVIGSIKTDQQKKNKQGKNKSEY